jgi:thiol-disulfide isomerase/thioredoxin
MKSAVLFLRIFVTLIILVSFQFCAAQSVSEDSTNVLSFNKTLRNPNTEELKKLKEKQIDFENAKFFTNTGVELPNNSIKSILASASVKFMPRVVIETNEIVYVVQQLNEKEINARTEMVSKNSMVKEEIGKTAARFNEKSINGAKLKSKALKGKIIVLNFWFINCPPCKAEIPHLNNLQNKYKDTNVVFIAFALDRSGDVGDFLETQPFNYHVVADSKYLADVYNVKGYPTNIIIDEEGIVQFYTKGFSSLTVKLMEKKIEEMLSKSSVGRKVE